MLSERGKLNLVFYTARMHRVRLRGNVMRIYQACGIYRWISAALFRISTVLFIRLGALHKGNCTLEGWGWDYGCSDGISISSSAYWMVPSTTNVGLSTTKHIQMSRVRFRVRVRVDISGRFSSYNPNT